ncbi:unnamed protein product [Darwinula stevensoni]|uniref:Timeless N-terminal domain-containing protein n=1 Tax=Darwinula stevensoni TaxID=69355 RepID=A0A7R8XDT3_9CRUS|nr:unnamed protein product [Darwinula stevensoni]CAG0893386.1 unnamed protein product [Darwinula stevensoni]
MRPAGRSLSTAALKRKEKDYGVGRGDGNCTRAVVERQGDLGVELVRGQPPGGVIRPGLRGIMEWAVTNTASLYALCSSLGSQEAGFFKISPECLKTLLTIQMKLVSDEHPEFPFRRALGNVQLIEKELIPILIHCKKSEREVLQAAINVVVQLTTPIECLVLTPSCHNGPAILDLRCHLGEAKEAFLNPQATKVLVNNVLPSVMSKGGTYSLDNIGIVQGSLLLLRNLLHIPDWFARLRPVSTPCHKGVRGSCEMQNQLMATLFAQGLDQNLLTLMAHPLLGTWCVSVAELVAILYRDQEVGVLQKLIAQWMEKDPNDTSDDDDDESNTSPQGTWCVSVAELVAILYRDQEVGILQKLIAQWMEKDPNDTSDDDDDESNTSPQEDGNQGHSDIPLSTESSDNDLRLQDYKSCSEENVDGETQVNLLVLPDDNTWSKLGKQTMFFNSSSTCFNEKMEEEAEKEEEGEKMKHLVDDSSEVDSGLASLVKDEEVQLEKGYGEGGLEVGIVSKEKEERSLVMVLSQDKGTNYCHRNECRDSPSSNEEDMTLHCARSRQPPPHPMKQRPPRYLQLIRRRKMHIRRRIGNNPAQARSNEDISHLLRDFTVEFLFCGYGPLLHSLTEVLGSAQASSLDSAHFLWLITYFLKFVPQLHVDFSHLSQVLSPQLLSYLTFQSMNLSEEAGRASLLTGGDPLPIQRRLHLLVTALREFLQALDSYSHSCQISTKEKFALRQLQGFVGDLSELRESLVYLIRKWNPQQQSRQCLRDLVATHHSLLVCLQGVTSPLDIRLHLENFATCRMIRQLGELLSSYSENGTSVNEATFTLLHHIVGSLHHPHRLLDPSLLRAFTSIWENGIQLPEEWSDVVELVMRLFIHRVTDKIPLDQNAPLPAISFATCRMIRQLGELLSSYSENGTSVNEATFTLLHHIVGSLHHPHRLLDPSLLRAFTSIWENGIQLPEEWSDVVELVMRLFIHRVTDKIPLDQNAPLPAISEGEPGDDICWAFLQSSGEQDPLHCVTHRFPQLSKDEILAELIKRNLISSEEKTHLAAMYLSAHQSEVIPGASSVIWLQKLFLQAACIRLCLDRESKWSEDQGLLLHPTVLFPLLVKQGVPLIPWHEWQEEALEDPEFLSLISKLSLDNAENIRKGIHPTIPPSWDTSKLYAAAASLGLISIDEHLASALQTHEEEQKQPENSNHKSSPQSPLGLTVPGMSWMDVVHGNEPLYLSSPLTSEEDEGLISDCSNPDNLTTSKPHSTFSHFR